MQMVREALLVAAIVTMAIMTQRSLAQPKDTSQADTEKKQPPKIDKLDEEILRRAKVALYASALLEFFRKRTLPEEDRPEVERLVQRLGSSVFLVRERAARELIARGIASVEMLRAGLGSSDIERSRRIEQLLTRIKEDDHPPEVLAAAVRVLAAHRPEGMNRALVDFLPFADHEAVVDELRFALRNNAVQSDKADPVLLAALRDRAPLRRATAAEALARNALDAQKNELRKLLTDKDASVRFRVARALAFAGQPDAVPVLIDTLPSLPLQAAWQVEDFLLQLSAGANPPSAPMGNDVAERNRCRAAWAEWWKKNQMKVDFKKLEEPPRLLNRTLMVLLDQGTVQELDADNAVRFQIKNLVLPLDAQMLDDNRVLIAEYHGNRITERNTRTGDILWQRAVGSPLVAQRLANGNTFVATPHELLEFDKDNQQVLNVTLSQDNQYIMKAVKLPNGEIVCMCADARVVRYSASGKELSSFSIPLSQRLFGGRIQVLPSGRILVPHNAEGKVREYDASGKVMWEIAFEAPIAAARLPNGHTFITSMNPQVGAVEVDRLGAPLWNYQHVSNTRVTRAYKR